MNSSLLIANANAPLRSRDEAHDDGKDVNKRGIGTSDIADHYIIFGYIQEAGPAARTAVEASPDPGPV
jgi:hypothetical protein